ncbi:hypothetical protein FRC10_003203, partial [Ceratobasidium sp. 414]
QARERSRVSPKPLRANVLLDESVDPNVYANGRWEKLLVEADGADTLLVVGTSLRTNEICSLVDELTQRVHSNEGAVVFIDLEDHSVSQLAHMVDFFIQLDVQQCAETLLAILNQDSPESAQDIWEEFQEPVLPTKLVPPLPPSAARRCCQCALSLQDALLACITCGTVYCFEDPQNPLGSMCVSLNYLVAPPSGVSLAASIEAFQCYECYDHAQPAMYPQFWPYTEHAITAIANSWALEGWEVCIT